MGEGVTIGLMPWWRKGEVRRAEKAYHMDTCMVMLRAALCGTLLALWLARGEVCAVPEYGVRHPLTGSQADDWEDR